MDRKAKLAMLQGLSEDRLRKEVLIPLFRAMKFKDVIEYHGTAEKGKDIIYYTEDSFGDRSYTSVVVKKTTITGAVGKKGNAKEILFQIEQSFDEPYTDVYGLKELVIDKCVVVTCKDIKNTAIESIRGKLKKSNLDKLLRFIDGNKLIELLDKHMPNYFFKEIEYFNTYFNALKTDFERIKDISAIGQKEPVPLENIYVSLKLTETVKEREIPVDEDRKIVEDELIRKELEGPAERARVLDAERAITDYNKLVIVGAPGSGKTTLLKHLALKSCTENLKVLERTCVPIPITLRELADSGKDIRQYIDDVFEKYQFHEAKEFVEKDLKTGKCQLLLDGFDELATKEQQEQIAVLIHQFMEKYHKCQVVVTSRIAGYHDELSGFTKLELMEFDDKQIEKFIQNWFGESGNKGK
jgi:predicted NACHT family NTPase